MRVASREMRVAGREMRLQKCGCRNAVASRELRLPNVEGLGILWRTPMAYP